MHDIQIEQDEDSDDRLLETQDPLAYALKRLDFLSEMIQRKRELVKAK